MHAKCVIGIVLLILLLSSLTRKEGFQGNATNIEIVVANYEEDISWIKDIPENLYSRITIYNKGSPKVYTIPRSNVVTLPNIGREAHTYLHHIINNYDTLADVTLFLPGSTTSFDQKKAQLDILLEFLKGDQQHSRVVGIRDPAYIGDQLRHLQIDEYEVTHDKNKAANPDTKLTPAAVRPFGAWLQARFPGSDLRCITYRGLILASRADIHKRSKAKYQELIGELMVKNAEAVHFMERSWNIILSIPDESCGGASLSS
jgi:hypothetical protein